MDTLHENEIGTMIVNRCFKIHRMYGPGLLESAYQKLLVYELEQAGLAVRTEVSVPIHHEGIEILTGFRADIIVEEKVIIELKAIQELNEVHFKQLITYLKLTGLKLGYLVNFREALLKNGIRRMLNGYLSPMPE